MASQVKFDGGKMTAAFLDIRASLQAAAERGMQKAMAQAEKDAQGTAHWREANTYTLDYPSGEWTWTVTGLARSSITAYVVPNKRLKHFPDYFTTSYWNGMPKVHPHRFDDSLTSSPGPDPDRVIGIITMNVAYAPYLQDYEQEIGVQPIVVEVLEMNWTPVYVPVIRGVMQVEMARIAAKYT